MLQAEELIKIYVDCNDAMDVQDDGSGYLRIIPIIGGYFEGKLNGKVIPLGADWNTTRTNSTAHVFAKYLLQTTEGDYIAIENEGYIQFDQLERRIKTVPRFQVSNQSQYHWLNTGVYVGALEDGNKENQVVVTIYQIL